jgi:rRNA biogenesis protein RRP5
MVKKYSQDPSVWENYAAFLYNVQAQPDRARELLPKALQSLPNHVHIDITRDFARLEFRSKNGQPERGRTIFEGLFSNFPKRLDLWNILLDLEMKVSEKEEIRRLFERVTSLKMKPRQAQKFFNRWLNYEEKNGDEKAKEKVKAKAEEYVKRQKGAKE